MPRKLSIVQVNTLVAIRNFRHLHGYAPTIRELAVLLGISKGSTVTRLNRLIKRGLLTSNQRRHRCMEIIPPPPPKKLDKPEPEIEDDLIRM